MERVVHVPAGLIHQEYILEVRLSSSTSSCECVFSVIISSVYENTIYRSIFSKSVSTLLAECLWSGQTFRLEV